MSILKAIEVYLTTRKAKGEDSDYKDRKEHFDKLLTNLRNNQRIEFQLLLNEGIKLFKSFGRSNQYAGFLSQLKSTLSQPDGFNKLNQEAQNSYFFVSHSDDNTTQETIALVEIKHKLYVIAPKLFLSSTNDAEEKLLNAVNSKFAAIYSNENSAIEKVRVFGSSGHAVIQIQVTKKFYQDATEQYQNITEFQLKKPVTKENLHSILNMYDGKRLTIDEFILRDNQELKHHSSKSTSEFNR